jgi:ABC-type multidrug transport system fused ATPase/permease subunit
MVPFWQQSLIIIGGARKLMRLLGKAAGSKSAVPSDTVSLLRRVIADQGTKHWRSYALAYVLMAVAAACTAASAYIVGHAINVIYSSGNLWAMMATCLTITAIFIVKGLASYGQGVVLANINLTIASEYKILLFARMLRESLGYFANRHSAEVIGSLNFAGGSVGGLLTTLIVATGNNAITLIGLVGVMFVQAPLPSLICCIVMPLTALTLRRIRDRVRYLTEQQLAQSNAVFETSQETLQGLRVVKAFGLEEAIERKYRDGVEAMEAGSSEVVRISSRSGPLLEAMGGIAVALLFMYGAYRVIVVGAQPGEIFSFVAAFLLAYEPLKGLIRIHVSLSSMLVGVRTLYAFLDAPETEPDDSHLPALTVTAGAIQFRDVVFSYRLGESVLRRLSFAAPGGRTTALVGASGGGKSTIFNLLLRLYEPENGAIVIDGQEIAKVSRRTIRSQIAYVGQDTFLFRGTIRENILVGKPDATEEEIRAAATGAFAHDFICRFPQGYDTPVGEHGTQLSTGQRQRIAIARALVRNAPIVLLDESTASLDSESEREVRDAIAHVCKNRTTLVIAHRLHTVLDADRIIVVENGTIAEAGTYDELLRRQGRFAVLSKLQFNGQAA